MLNDAVVKSYAENHNCSYALAYADCERIAAGLPVKEHKSSVDEFGGEGSGNFGHEGRPGEIGGSGEGGSSISKSVEEYPGGKAILSEHKDVLKDAGLSISSSRKSTNSFGDDIIETRFIGQMNKKDVKGKVLTRKNRSGYLAHDVTIEDDTFGFGTGSEKPDLSGAIDSLKRKINAEYKPMK